MRTYIMTAGVVLLTACQGIVGSGTVTTEVREVGAFKKLNISSALVAHVTTGARSVTLRADDNIAPYIETVIEGDTLVARVKPNTSIIKSAAMELTIVNDVIEGVIASGAALVTTPATAVTDFPVTVSGASKVAVTGISATKVSLEASGASEVTLAGAATSESISASGSSTLDLRNLPVQTASLDVSGASSVRATVSGTLSGSVSGASTVSITGTPGGDVSVTGASSLKKGAP